MATYSRSTHTTMIKVETTIRGTAPLLMHRFTADGDGWSATRPPRLAEESPRDIAERVAYRAPDGGLFLPAIHVIQLLRAAADAYPRWSTKRLVPASVRIDVHSIPLLAADRKTPLVDFAVDARAVRIPGTRRRAMRYRPRLEHWAARFELRVNDNLVAPALVRDLLGAGGRQIGVGDYRPERGGSFGTFAVVGWAQVGGMEVAA